jgi:hypothetical protein
MGFAKAVIQAIQSSVWNAPRRLPVQCVAPTRKSIMDCATKTFLTVRSTLSLNRQ